MKSSSFLAGILVFLCCQHLSIVSATTRVTVSNKAKSQNDAPLLKQGDSLERKLAGNEAQTYKLSLNQGQYLSLSVVQNGIDVIVTLSDPGGQKVAEAATTIWTSNDKPILFIANTAGNYQLTVRAKRSDAAQGSYTLKVLELKAATEQDRTWVQGKNLTADAIAAREKYSAESLKEAVNLYRKAIAFWQTAGDKREEAYARHGLGFTLTFLSENDQALTAYQEALPLWRAAGERKGEAMTLSNIGGIYQNRAEYTPALEYYQQALLMRREVGDVEGESNTMSNMAGIYYVLGDMTQAIQVQEKALALARQIKNERYIAFALDNLSAMHESLNDLQTALDYVREEVEIRQHLPNKIELASALLQLGSVNLSLGDTVQALECYTKALPIVRATGNREAEALVLAGFGLSNQKAQSYAEALDYFNQANQIAKSLGNRLVEADQYSHLGNVYLAMKDYQKAIDQYLQAQQLYKSLSIRQSELITLNNLGNAQLGLKNYDEAMKNLETVLAAGRQTKDLFIEIPALVAIAKVESERGNLSAAKEHIESALGMVETVRGQLREEETRNSYSAFKREYYDFYIDLLMRMSKGSAGEERRTRALLASEQYRARSLAEMLKRSHAEIQGDADPELLLREKTLNQKIQAKSQTLTQLIQSKQAAAKIEAGEKELSDLMNQHRQVRAEIRAKNPRYAALIQPQSLSLAEIQQLLTPDTVLLEYLLGKDRSYLWVVSKTNVSSYELPNRVDIEAMARRVYELFNRSYERTVRGQAQIAASELSKVVLGPAARQLQGKRLIIVADGALQYVPFAALPEPIITSGEMSGAKGQTKTSGEQISDSAQPLIINHEIAYLPSASILPLLRQENSTQGKADKAIAIIADPVFQPDDQRVKSAIAKSNANTQELLAIKAQGRGEQLTRSGSESGASEFARLPYTRQEAEAIASLTATTASLKALDFKASRATALGAGLNHYRILHFATHGLLNSRHPELSGLVLSLVDEQGQGQDGFLRLHDIYNLKLNAELVVLSACRTALGKEISGEGLIGLTRGFMYAGAKSVIASLWDVRDEATAELMKRFYQKMLKEGQSPSAALRAAQISIMQEQRWAAPYFWAGFTVQGAESK